MTLRLIDTSFAICGVCGDEHDCGFGYAPTPNDKIMWTCTQCIPLGKGVYAMKQAERSAVDQQARDHAGAKGGEYLESIGRMDLGSLAPDEWTTFLDILFREKAAEMRRLYKNICPPF
jgi:hypothetical protein